MSVKIIVHYGWNPSICFCENDKYLKSIADTSVIMCDEVISVIDIVSTKMTKYYSKNVSINPDCRKVRYKFDCYILHAVLLATILLLMITLVWYHYAMHKLLTY